MPSLYLWLETHDLFCYSACYIYSANQTESKVLGQNPPNAVCLTPHGTRIVGLCTMPVAVAAAELFQHPGYCDS